MLACRCNAAEVGHNIRVAECLRLALYKRAIAKNRRQRCAELVAHGGQKGALGAAAGFRLVARDGKLAQGRVKSIPLPHQLMCPLFDPLLNFGI